MSLSLASSSIVVDKLVPSAVNIPSLYSMFSSFIFNFFAASVFVCLIISSEATLIAAPPTGTDLVHLVRAAIAIRY